MLRMSESSQSEHRCAAVHVGNGVNCSVNILLCSDFSWNNVTGKLITKAFTKALHVISLVSNSGRKSINPSYPSGRHCYVHKLNQHINSHICTTRLTARQR